MWKAFVPVGLVVWLGGVAAGSAWLWRYENTPAAETHSAVSWPSNTPMSLTTGRPTLVLAVHPQCPCSRASLAELATIVGRAQGRFAAHVLFYKPQDAAPDWEKTDLWRAAGEIPGVSRWTDDEGRLAKGFGATTSGQALLFDAVGALRFNGGITVSRGHVGDNPAVDAILEIIRGGHPSRTRSPVFGCSLYTPMAAAGEAEKAGR